MTKEQIDTILDRVRTWPADRQEEAAAMLLVLEAEANEDAEEPSEELLADLREAEAEADRGGFVPNEEMKAFFAQYR